MGYCNVNGRKTVNDESEKIRNEVVVAYFKAIPQHLPGGCPRRNLGVSSASPPGRSAGTRLCGYRAGVCGAEKFPS
jgi:hypothetical protein